MEIPLEESVNMIDLNCSGTVRMTELTLPYIKERGRIMQISSISSFAPIPYVNVYAATKAFIKNYPIALNAELKPRKLQLLAFRSLDKNSVFDRAKLTEKKLLLIMQQCMTQK